MTVTNRPHRANGNGSVYFMTARNRWACAVTLPVTGKRQVRTFKTEAAAKLHLKDTLKAIDNQAVPLADARLTTATYLLGWLDNVVKVTQKPLTHQTYSYIASGRLIPAFGKVPLVKLSTSHVAQLQREMFDAGLSLNTIKAMRTCLGAALSYAVDQQLIPVNLVGKVKLPRPTNLDDEDAQHEARVFSKEEIDRFLAAASGDDFEPMFRFMLSTGLRPGEARGVRWQDVDLEQRVLTVRRQSIELKGGLRQFDTPKSRKGRRQIPLLPPALAVLRAQKQRVAFLSQSPDWQDLNLVFPGTHGRPIVARTVNLHMTALCKQAGIAHATPHTLRHSAATFLLAAGVNQQVVMTYLGHASAGTTAMYQHVMPDMLRLAGQMLDEYFKANGIMY